MAIRVLIDTLSCQEAPGAGGIRALRCLTRGEEQVPIRSLFVTAHHRFLRGRAWERKSLHATIYSGASGLIAKFRIFSRYRAAFRWRFPRSGGTGGNRDPVKETAKKLLNDRESKPPSRFPSHR
jgi:hypothetical protein